MQSYTRGPKGTVVRKTIGEAFLETANRFADRVALIGRHQNIRLTWAEYANEAQRVAAGLRAVGMRPGDRVGVWASNCAEWPILQFGCGRATHRSKRPSWPSTRGRTTSIFEQISIRANSAGRACWFRSYWESPFRLIRRL